MKHILNQAVIDQIQPNYKHQPLACFLIGANGSGKSTLRNYLNLSEIQTNIDPDALNRIAKYQHKENYQLYASKQALRLFSQAIDQHLNLCMESTLSGKGTIKRIQQAKARGYYLIGYFLGVNGVEININRVKNRVLQGGHDIEKSLIIRRYDESIKNLLKVYSLFDELYIIDNTNEFYELQFSKYKQALTKNKKMLIDWANHLYNDLEHS